VFESGGKHRSKKEEPGQGQSSGGIGTGLVCRHHRLIHWQAGLEREGWLSHCQENTELSASASVESFRAAQMWKHLYEMLKLEINRAV